jgi:hypothetical protein
MRYVCSTRLINEKEEVLMDIVGIFKESVEVSKKNYIIFAPTVAVAVVMSVLTLILVGSGVLSIGLMGGGMHSPGGMMPLIGAMMGGLFIVAVLGTILGLIAHGMTVGMAREVIEKGSTSLNSGFSVAMGRLAQLVVASTLVGIIVFVGFMLLFIPGLIAAFFLMFTFVSVIVDNTGAVEAMKKSYATVKTNLNDSIVFFIGMIAVGVVFAVANAVLNVIPILGQLLGMALIGAFGGYISVVIVKVYLELTKGT